MAKEIILGIDLGTTNSVVSYLQSDGTVKVIPNPEGSRTTPSIVGFSKTGEKLVGQLAKRQAILNPDKTIASIKRHMGSDYKVDIDEERNVRIDMTLTAPNCPAADFILEDVRQKIESIDGVKSVEVNLVFEPEWDRDMMTEEAKLELGML